MLMNSTMAEGIARSGIARGQGEPFKVLDWVQVEEVIEKHNIKNACVGLQEDWDATSAICLIDGVRCKTSEHSSCYGFYGGSMWATPILYDRDTEKCYECWTVNDDYEPEYWHWED